MMNDAATGRMQRAADELKAHIAAVRDAKIAVIEGDTQRKASAAVREARAHTTAKVRSVLAEERRRRREELLHAAGEADAAVRREEDRRIQALLDDALVRLEQELTARWMDPQVQARWLAISLDTTAGRLEAGVWRLEHPANWDSRAGDDVLYEFAEHHAGVRVVLSPAIDLRCGFRLVQEGVLVDTTLSAVFVDRHRLQAELRGLLERDAAWPDRVHAESGRD